MIYYYGKLFFKNIFSNSFSRKLNTVWLSRKYIKNMDTAHFRYAVGDENFDFTFLYGGSSKSIRQFNFMRQSTETVGTFLSRVSTNVGKVLEKKNKKKKKKKEDVAVEDSCEGPPIIKLIQNGNSIPDESLCVDVIKPNSNIELHIFNNVFNITVNAPWITNLTLPRSILAGFPLYPLKFEGKFLSKEKSTFEWYVGNFNSIIANIKWEKIGEGFTIYPSAVNIGKRIKLICLPGNETMGGPQVEVISVVNIEAGPGFCPFENRHSFTENKLKGDKIRVVSYNILADLYCDSDFSRQELFPYCPPYALEVDYRKQLFLKEILGYNGDIVCLQEVDAKVFDSDLLPVMTEKSYGGIFTRKGGQVAEGVACFFRRDRFCLIEERSCILGNELKSPIFKDIWARIENNEPFVNRLQPRTTAVQATILQSIENPNEILIVGNTHFYFQPDSDHVRVMQGGLTILWLCNIMNELKEKFNNKRVSLILCGDFNSVPSCGVYQLYTTGHVPNDCIDWSSNESEKVTNVTLTQPLILGSACGTPEFTNFTVGFADCLDYIFYQKSSFDVVQVVPLPSVEELSQHSALPSVVFPSDHVSLVADLQFKPV